jgi:hypothetical protein
MSSPGILETKAKKKKGTFMHDAKKLVSYGIIIRQERSACGRENANTFKHC